MASTPLASNMAPSCKCAWLLPHPTSLSLSASFFDSLSAPRRQLTLTRWHSSPGIFAPHHQHLFNLRIEPAIDDYEDSAIVYEETHAMPRDPIRNPYGVGFESFTTPVTHESAFNLEWQTNRGELPLMLLSFAEPRPSAC